MKKMILAALVLCALLSGCGKKDPVRAIQERLSPATVLENDDLRAFSLEAAGCRFLSYGKDLLVLRPAGEEAELLRCTGRGLVIEERARVSRGGELLTGGEKIGYYDPAGQRLLLFSPSLTLEGEYPLPECGSTPVMNEAGDRVYYLAAQELVELDTETGIHRTLRQRAHQAPTGLVEEEGILICAGEGESRYLRVADGSLAAISPLVRDQAKGGSWLCLACGHWDCLYLGQTMLPLQADWRFLAFLPKKNAALVLRPEKALAIYDLTTGNCLAELEAPAAPEEALAGTDGRVYFTAGGKLYLWEPVWKSSRDSRVRITALYTREAPDEKGLAQCRREANVLQERYGVQVLLGPEAVRMSPKGVKLESEYLSAPIQDTLKKIESALGRFPMELVKAAFSGGGSFYICPVRGIRGGEGEEYGLQFWTGRDCCLVVAVSDQVEQTVTRLLSALLERQIRMRCDALDNWEELNPPDFSYGQSEWDETAFVSPAAMHSPAADRAELLWAAMEPDAGERFLYARLQNKLRALCTGIRKAIPLESGNSLPWEQYLWTS